MMLKVHLFTGKHAYAYSHNDVWQQDRFAPIISRRRQDRHNAGEWRKISKGREYIPTLLPLFPDVLWICSKYRCSTDF